MKDKMLSGREFSAVEIMDEPKGALINFDLGIEDLWESLNDDSMILSDDFNDNLLLKYTEERVINQTTLKTETEDVPQFEEMNESLEKEIIIASQEVEFQDNIRNFGNASLEEILQKIKETKNPNTAHATIWSVELFHRWYNQQPRCFSSKDNLLQMDLEDMGQNLAMFFHNVRKTDGSEYPPKTLYALACGIVRYLKENNRAECNIFGNRYGPLEIAYQSLDSKMKEATMKGLGQNIKQAEPITSDQEEQLFSRNIFGEGSSMCLLRTVYYFNCKLYGLRGRDEHRNLKREQFELGPDFIKFLGRASKNYKGGVKDRKIESKAITHYCDNNSPRNPLKYFKIYFNSTPKTGPFYRKPLKQKGNEILRFGIHPVGVNTLSKIIPDSMRQAKIPGYFTAHSGKVTTATSLFRAGVPEKLIRERTGHRSDALFRYERPSEAQRRSVSAILNPSSSNNADQKTPVVAGNPKQNQDKEEDTEKRNLQGKYVFQNCVFHING